MTDGKLINDDFNKRQSSHKDANHLLALLCKYQKTGRNMKIPDKVDREKLFHPQPKDKNKRQEMKRGCRRGKNKTERYGEMC